MKIVGEDNVENCESEKYFFEGTEKLLEVWFDCSNGDEGADLRVIERYVKFPSIILCNILATSLMFLLALPYVRQPTPIVVSYIRSVNFH